MMSNHTFWMIAPLAAALLVPGCGSPTQQLAFVDAQRALNETDEGRAAKAQLKALFNSRQLELDMRQQQLKGMEAMLQAQKGRVPREVYESQVEVYRRSYGELQNAFRRYQNDLTAREEASTGPILHKMQAVIGEIAEDEGYELVLEVNEGGAFYYNKAADITERVIETYNNRHKAQKAPPPLPPLPPQNLPPLPQLDVSARERSLSALPTHP